MSSFDRLRGMLATLAKGVAMGVVEIVPGVSGGTMALILGIYGELIGAIDATFAWIGRALRRLLPGLVGSVAPRDAPPVAFLVLLGIGMAAAVLAGSHLVDKLLSTARGPTYAFFCGIVLASVATPLRLMERRGAGELSLILIGAVASFLATGLSAGAVREPGLAFLLLSGVVAVAVLVLPGVSGSFVLLAMGSYNYVIERVRGVTAGELAESGLPLIVFSLGMVLGMLTAARLVSWMLARYQSLTLAVLTGLMLGSLRALWPFLRDGDEVPLGEVGTLGMELLPLAVAAAAGAAVVIVLARASRGRR